MTLRVEAVFEYNKIPAPEMWERLSVTHPELIQSNTQCDLYGSVVRASQVSSAMRRRSKPHFDVEFTKGTLSYAAVGNHHLSFAQVIKCVSDDEDAGRWLSEVISLEFFIQARAYDEEYDFWQNANDPLQYEARGRSLEGLKMFCDDALSHDFIDISLNPGRRVLRDGYIEALGHVMWVAPRFWKMVGRSLSQIEASGTSHLISEVSEVGGVSRLRFSSKPFTTAEGEEGALQNRMRALLFP